MTSQKETLDQKHSARKPPRYVALKEAQNNRNAGNVVLDSCWSVLVAILAFKETALGSVFGGHELGVQKVNK